MALSSHASFTSKFDEKRLDVTRVLRAEAKHLTDGTPCDTLLYSYQVKAVLAVRDHFQGSGRPSSQKIALVVAPPGSGKTGMSNLIPYILGSERVLVLSPSPLISAQMATTFGYNGFAKSFFHNTRLTNSSPQFEQYKVMPFLVEKADDVNRMHNYSLVIVNAQKFGGNSNTSLFHRKEKIVTNVKKAFRAFSTIIVDEAQHYPAKTWKAIVENFTGKQIVFFTAVPLNRGREILPNQIFTYEVKQKEVEGNTTRKRKFEELEIKLPHSFNFDQASLELIGVRVNRILDEHDALEPDVQHKAMVLVQFIRHAESVAASMENATYYTSEPSTKDNLKDFMASKHRIMAVCRKCTEGYDNKDVSVCVILMNVSSRQLFQQFVGRCSRCSFKGDQVTAVLLSHPIFNQRQMWEGSFQLSETDPDDDEDDS